MFEETEIYSSQTEYTKKSVIPLLTHKKLIQLFQKAHRRTEDLRKF